MSLLHFCISSSGPDFFGLAVIYVPGGSINCTITTIECLFVCLGFRTQQIQKVVARTRFYHPVDLRCCSANICLGTLYTYHEIGTGIQEVHKGIA